MIDPHLHERFISLLETNLGVILKISKAYTSTAQDKEDLVNDIAYEMWKAFPKFKGESKVSTWIYRVALNTAMNYQKKSRKRRDFLQDAIDFYAEPHHDMDSNTQVEQLYDLIEELEEFNKAIILLYLDGYKHDEIAEITGISETNVGTRISRIKQQLKFKADKQIVHHGT